MREQLEAAIEERVSAIVLFWGDPGPFLENAPRSGVRVFVQVGSLEEAKAAADAGVDAVIAQGFEAGGHVRGTVVEAVGPLPVLAAGGIGDGAGLARALELGAQAVSLAGAELLGLATNSSAQGVDGPVDVVGGVVEREAEPAAGERVEREVPVGQGRAVAARPRLDAARRSRASASSTGCRPATLNATRGERVAGSAGPYSRQARDRAQLLASRGSVSIRVCRPIGFIVCSTVGLGTGAVEPK